MTSRKLRCFGYGIVLILGNLSSGCAGRQLYYRSLDPHSTPKGVPGATFKMPGSATGSEVRIQPLGVVDSNLNDVSRVLQVRFFVEDLEPEPWLVEFHQQRVTFPGVETPIEAGTNGKFDSASTVRVTPGHTQVVDLFFPMPNPVKKNQDLPFFTLNWELQTPGHEFKGSTRFELTQAGSERSHSSHVPLVMPENGGMRVPGVNGIR